ncbi:MAG: BREX-1 system adenine-specific DNA-methyltransferase PglX, partial [Oscillospiraceae bacterium]|nr:BREX-1 system adenine-specific DNA-methyltransferase PglX [Oscillospiraceae bacterium]
MNKSAIQKYAVWARNELIAQVKQRAYLYGINENGCGAAKAAVGDEAVNGRALSESEIKQLCKLINHTEGHGFQQTAEEVAYTWFNRLVALRFMEVNDYLPTHIRVFSDSTGAFKPEILKDALHLDLDGLDKKQVAELLNGNKTDELYRYLLLTQCNALNAALPEMFERLDDYTEMLLPGNILKDDGVIGRLVSDIPEEDWRNAVQIIGWLYQYYNTEPKQAVFDGLKKNVKITKENIPVATQLFTPDWIARYMVENSLGRLWLEGHPNAALKAEWKYYLDEAEQSPEVAVKLEAIRREYRGLNPEGIRFIDPCVGSGHILVYAFDVLMQIYRSEGYTDRDAVRLILEKNLYGLDIDRRAYQLAYFALMMKARQYNRRIFHENIRPQVYHPTGWDDGEEYGSLVKIDDPGEKPEHKAEQATLFDNYERDLRVWNFKRLLSLKYDVVVTNPPYMGGGSMNGKLSEFVKRQYADSKSDLFAAFIERCATFTKANGYQAMITQHDWMFLSSYEKLRGKVQTRDTVNMAHLGARAFADIGGEVVQSTAFVMRGSHINGYKGVYVRLVDIDVADGKEREFLSGSHRCSADSGNFAKIPGSPVAYWLSKVILLPFEIADTVSKVAEGKVGLQTGNNDLFLRLWFEVIIDTISFRADSSFKWFPYNKGGSYRRWYGNAEYVLNWANKGNGIKSFQGSFPRNTQYYFQEGLTWSDVATGNISMRYMPSGFAFDTCAPCLFSSKDRTILLGFFNTKVAQAYMTIMSPTIHYTCGTLLSVPFIRPETIIDVLVAANISLSRADWDAFETSWDFKRHPFIGGRSIAAAFFAWENECEERFETLKDNEEELNRIFIDIYGLQDELTPEVDDKDVTVRRADLGREMRSFISYAVGCMFGRYSLDVDGLAYAGGAWDSGKYRTFIPDADNVLPICDDEYFDDDICGRFVDFVRTVYGADALEENLRFIAAVLGGVGTPREVVRRYFLNDFYKDHLKIYQKRPIYWLFDSGKKNGFKALVYLHRYQSDLLAKLRTDYVHEQQERYRTQLNHVANAMNTATGVERATLLKAQEKFTAQAAEIAVFEEKIHHLADMHIN